MSPAGDMPAVVATDLNKRYGATVALDGLSFEFPSGRLTGFLGPNGAGKTTTLRSILGLTRLDSGTVTVLGRPIETQLPEIVKHVGAIVDEPGLLRPLSGRHNLVVAAHTLGFGHDRIDDLAGFVELSADLDRAVSGYSKGMRQRLALAAALIGDPQILFLDEPLDGLDPAGQLTFKRRLRQLVNEERRTVVMSSHNLTDVQALADHVVLIAGGSLRYQGPLPDLLGGARAFRVTVSDSAAAQRALVEVGLDVEVVGDGSLVVAADDGSAVSRILAQADIFPSALVPADQTLESVFLDLTST